MRIRTKSLFVSTVWIKGEADIMKLVSLFPASVFTYSVNNRRVLGKGLAQDGAQRGAK